jgi:NADPH:quinone reductase-like Zn-dependent oxidoreductase
MVKELPEKGEGIDNILEISGGKSLHQSFKSVKLGGLIMLIGILDGFQPKKIA